MSFRDLTESQVIELRDILADFVSDRCHDGLQCVVLIRGRGQERMGYSSNFTPDSEALDMCEVAVTTMKAKITGALN